MIFFIKIWIKIKILKLLTKFRFLTMISIFSKKEYFTKNIGLGKT